MAEQERVEDVDPEEDEAVEDEVEENGAAPVFHRYEAGDAEGACISTTMWGCPGIEQLFSSGTRT